MCIDKIHITHELPFITLRNSSRNPIYHSLLQTSLNQFYRIQRITKNFKLLLSMRKSRQPATETRIELHRGWRGRAGNSGAGRGSASQFAGNAHEQLATKGESQRPRANPAPGARVTCAKSARLGRLAYTRARERSRVGKGGVDCETRN